MQALLDDLPSDDEIAKKTSANLYPNGIGDWMNQSLWSFIDASIAGGQDSKTGINADTPEQAWKAAAHIIHFGKIYE